MDDSTIPSQAVRDALSPFGALRPQPRSDWTGEGDLHPSLIRFHAEVGPHGADAPDGPEGLFIPTAGDPFHLPSLGGLRDFQAGYRHDGLTGERLPGWPDEWLVVADQGGDPFILDAANGRILHARHGEGEWDADALFPDIFVMALVLGMIGAVHEDAGDALHDEDYNVRPCWRALLGDRLTPVLGATDGPAMAALFL